MFGARLRKAPERLAQLTSPTLVQQQKPSRPSTLSEGRLRGRSATVAEKIKVLAQAAQLPTDAKGRKRGLADVAAETRGLFSPSGIRHVIQEAAALKGDEEEPLARKPQSPDLNMNDLAFFRALSVAVRKVRRGLMDFDIDKLAEDVRTCFDTYPEAKVAGMWDYLDYIYEAIIDAHGGNLYPQHR